MTMMQVTSTKTRSHLQAVFLTGQKLLENSLLNKGTAFTATERDVLDLWGLLPAHVSTLEEQVTRADEQCQQKDTDLERNVYLANLHDTNSPL